MPPVDGVALLSDQKRGKSHQRKAPRPPLQTTSHPVESAAESNARQVCAIHGKSKIFCPSLHASSAIPRVRTKYAAKSEQIRRGGWCHAEKYSYASHYRLNSDYASMALWASSWGEYSADLNRPKSVLNGGLNHTSGLVYVRTVGAVCSHKSPRGDRRC